MYIKHESSTDPISGEDHQVVHAAVPALPPVGGRHRTSLDAVAAEGPGHRYLIQHSAGSGKTNSIAWTAHRLATAARSSNEKVFDSVIVVTDRNVLDAQLQEAIKQIDNDQGIVVAIDRDEAARAGGSKSGLLAKALPDGKLIIVVTIQTFPFAMAEIRARQGPEGQEVRGHRRRGPLLPDRADRPKLQGRPDRRGGQGARGRRRDRRRGDPRRRDATERADSTEHVLLRVHRHPEGQDPGAVRTRARRRRTCRTPFHVYTMQQAIEEGFILDVLQGYHYVTTLAFQIGQNGQGTCRGEAEVDQSEATKGLMRWVKLHPTNIAQKVADHRRALPRRTSRTCSTGTPRRWSSPTPARRPSGTRWPSTSTSPSKGYEHRHPGRVLRLDQRRRVRA